MPDEESTPSGVGARPVILSRGTLHMWKNSDEGPGNARLTIVEVRDTALMRVHDACSLRPPPRQSVALARDVAAVNPERRGRDQLKFGT